MKILQKDRKLKMKAASSRKTLPLSKYQILGPMIQTVILGLTRIEAEVKPTIRLQVWLQHIGRVRPANFNC